MAGVEAATQVFGENIQADPGPSWLHSAQMGVCSCPTGRRGRHIWNMSVWRICCHLLPIVIYFLKCLAYFRNTGIWLDCVYYYHHPWMQNPYWTKWNGVYVVVCLCSIHHPSDELVTCPGFTTQRSPQHSQITALFGGDSVDWFLFCFKANKHPTTCSYC